MNKKLQGIYEKTATVTCCLGILQYGNPAQTQSGQLDKDL